MYSVHAYYSAVLCQAMTAIGIYPVLLTLFSFYFFDLEYSGAEELFTYMAALLMTAFCGSFCGLMIGAMTDDDMVAILIGNLIVTLFNFGAGFLGNAGPVGNPVIRILSWVSPVHYGTEIVFQIVTKGRYG